MMYPCAVKCCVALAEETAALCVVHKKYGKYGKDFRTGEFGIPLLDIDLNLPEKCTSCHGDKECSNCYGSGDCECGSCDVTHDCGICEGTGKCTMCEGIGLDPDYVADKNLYRVTELSPEDRAYLENIYYSE